MGWFSIGYKETSAHPLMRWVAFAAAVLFGVGTLQAIDAVSSKTSAQAANVSCATAGATAQNGYTEAPSHGQVMYIDSGVTPKIDAAYVGYKITNNSGSAKSIWVQLDNFTGGKVTLANPKDVYQELPNVANGASATAFFLLKAAGSTTAAQTHTVKVFEQRPDLAGATAKFTCDFSFVKVQETIKAASNKIDSSAGVTSAAAPATPTLGGTITVTVANSANTKTGNLGSGSAPDYSAFWASPAAYSTWPTRSLRLESTSITIECSGSTTIVLTNMLFASDTTAITSPTLGSCIGNGAGSKWYATYKFRIIGPGPASVKPAPVAQISSGTQYKHTDMSYTSGVTAISGLNAVSAAASATVSVTASSDTSDGTRVNVVYTVMVTSDTTDPAGIQIDELVDTHDAGSQYVSSSTSTKLGSVSYAAAPDPQSLAADSAKSPPPMHFIGPYTGIKSGTPQYLKYKFSVPCDGTVYKNTVVAYLGDVLIGKSASAASAISVSASSGSGACGSVSVQTTTTSLDPTATTQPAANVASSSATLNAIYNASGTTNSKVQFVYSTDPNLVTGRTTTTLKTLAAGSTANTVDTADITGLSPGTIYYFQAQVTNAAGTVFYGATLSFVTLQVQASPKITTAAATKIGATTATLNGSIAPSGTDIINVYFYYSSSSALSGSTTTLAATAANQYAVQTDNGSGVTTDLTFAAGTFGTTTFNSDSITAVQKTFSGTVVYFQAHATCTVNATYCPLGYVDGAVLSFTLGSASANTNAATAVGDTSATLNGTVNNNGLTGPTAISYCYGTGSTASYGQLQSCTTATPTPSSATGSSETAATYAATGLSHGTTYYFQIIATVSGKTTYGSILSFQTIDITTASLADGYVSESYSTSLEGIGGSTTYSWSATGLPAGLTVSSTGVLSGTPTTAGTYTVVVTMTDLSSGLTTTETYSLVIRLRTSTPIVTTSAASLVTSTTATLNGSVTLNNNTASDAKFCLGISSALTTCDSVDALDALVSISGANAVSKPVSGLTAGTIYYYTLVVVSSAGTVTSSPVIQFKTASAVTNSATGIGLAGAILNGTLYAGTTAISNSQIQAVYLCYSTSASLTNGTLDTAPDCGSNLWTGTSSVGSNSTLAFSRSLTNLNAPPPLTLQSQLQVVFSTSPAVVANGSVVPFTTLDAPDVAVNSADKVSSKGARLHGLVYPKGNKLTQVSFCWYETAAPTIVTCTDPVSSSELANKSGNATWNESSSTGTTDLTLTGLKPRTNYTYYIKATSGSLGGAKLRRATVNNNVQSTTTSFTTAGAETYSATNVDTTSATLNGTLFAPSAGIAATGDITSVKICYSQSSSVDANGLISTATCTNDLWTGTAIAGNGSLAYAPGITGLTSNQTYYFQIQVLFTDGATAIGSVQNFTTRSTVSFDSHGAGTYNSQTYAPGGSITDPGTPTRDGYVFNGWFTSATGGSALTFPYSPANGSGSFTLHAQWTLASYTVSFNTDGGSSVNSKSFNAFGSIDGTDTTSTKAGYNFLGWFSSPTSTTAITFPYSPGVNTNVTLFAKWEAVEYAVTYFTNKSGTDTSVSSTAVYTIGSTLTQPTNPSNPGYSFAGWFSARTSGTAANFSTAQTGTGALSFYAQWTPYVVQFQYSGGGSTGIANVNGPVSSMPSGSGLTAPAGEQFTGWACPSGGSVYSAGSAFVPSADVICVAVFNLIGSKSVTFNSNYPNNSLSASTSTQTGSTSATLATSTFAITGYTLTGWNEVQGGTGTAHSLTSTHDFLSDLTLYAQWSANSYDVTFDPNYSGAPTVANGSYSVVTPANEPTAPVRSGYTFQGWHTSANVLVVWTSGTYQPAGTGTLALHAEWLRNSASITFHSNYPTGTQATHTQTSNATGVTLDAPTFVLTDHTFKRWIVGSASGTSYMLSTDTYDFGSNLDLYAEWTSELHDVIYDERGGSAIADGQYRTGGSISAPAITTKAGNRFDGWFDSTSGGVAHTFPYSPGGTSTVNLYAQWTPYTITFALGSGGSTPATGTAPNSTSGVTTLPGLGSMIAPAGYTFIGWVCPTGTVLLENAVVTPTGNTTCTAQWSSAAAKIVTFNSNYPLGSNTQTVQSASAAQALDANPFIAGGYRFIGWATSPTGAKSWDNTDVYDFSADISLYAVWEVIPVQNNSTPTYTIFFVYQGGTPGLTVTYYSPGDPALKLPTTEKPGYTFAGWSTTPSEPNTVTAPFTTRSSVTLFALWVAKTVTITFNYLGGITGIRTLSYTVGQPGFTGLPSSTKQGYEFAGWSEISGGSTAVTEPYAPLENLTLYAIWNGTKYTVTLQPQTGAPIKLVYTVGGAPLQLPSIGTKPGLVPVGWAPDNHATAAVPNAYRPSSTVTLFPLWLTDRLKTPLYFAGDSSVLDSKAKAILKATAKKITAAGLKPTLVVDGWVKATLDTSYDQKLSQARAVQTAAYLRTLGINAFAKLTPKGIAPQNNPTARRVDLAVYLGGAKTKK